MYKDKIDASSGLEESNKIRQEYKWGKLICLFLLWGLLVSLFFALERITWGGYGATLGYAVFIFICVLAVYTDHYAGVSTRKMEDLNGKKFNLYLRGFYQDNYYDRGQIYGTNWLSKIIQILTMGGTYVGLIFLAFVGRKKELSAVHFYEHLFYKYSRKLGKLVAVGMTRELDSPPGADRIYLAEESWKADVSRLMEQSHIIFILVNGRSNCLYETDIALSKYVDKTVFIVDTIEDYENLVTSIGHDEKTSMLPTLEKNAPPLYLFKKDGEWNQIKFFEMNFKERTKELVRRLR